MLQSIKSPADLKKLTLRELNQLAKEIRQQIISVVSSNGGHLASNLGAVEISIALHRVFNSPDDKIVWDVGHQCYAHKLLTGRLESFSSLRKRNGLCGFPKTSESPHDAFNTGHASTSISAALGLLAADKIQNKKTHAIAVIGDGALTGGLAYEALSHAGHLGLPLIVILNDNKMSISRNVGGLSKYLSRLSMKAKYQTFRRHFDALAKKLPFIGEAFFKLIVRLKRAVKAVFYIDNFFVDLGFEYVGPINGHNIGVLTDVLEDVCKLNLPVVIHVVTRKGKGFNYAEDKPDNYHGVVSFSINDGLTESININKNFNKSFTEAFSDMLLSTAKEDKRIVTITAAMKSGTGLAVFAQTFPDRFFDVGIAEGHAATFASGLAANNLRPVVALYSTFVQRAVDQIIHDAALQKLPVIFALDRAGFVSADGETHQGLFDISLFRSTPNITIFAPASENEMRLMFEWTLEQETLGPMIIRYPKANCPLEIEAFSLPLELGRGVFVTENDEKQVCLAFTGSLYREVVEAAAILKENQIKADLYNLRFLKPVDENYLIELMNTYKLTIFIEEGIKDGGFGEYASALALKHSVKTKLTILAAESSFLEGNNALGTREELLAVNGLDGKGIAKIVIDQLSFIKYP
ncbi:MAG: 1-deoxy-D-xylulose-5-phosphate synthase [Treponema sp.]|jgi:1-deoxy-D-xylulose-5-phosphate synthase|nr:1-deoxy-D-xylulose-5-phosphate synthase [Treponema sp.]